MARAGRRRKLLAVKEQFSAGNSARFGDESQNRQKHRTLAAAGLAHNTQNFTAVQPQIDAFDGRNCAAFGRKLGRQVLQFK